MRQSAACCLLAAAAAVLLFSQTADAGFAPSPSCYGSVGGASGHIYQFDGGIFSLRPRYCDVLLVRSQLKFCHLLIRAKFSPIGGKRKGAKLKGVSRLKRLSIIIDGRRFDLLTNRRLAVNGKLRNVPYSEKNVRAFMSGDDLVFVHKKCSLWVTFDGSYTATYRLGKMWRRRVEGLAGNCDGYKHNDPRGNPSILLPYLLRKGYVTKCRLCRRRRKYFGCHSRQELAVAKKRCARVIFSSRSCKGTDVFQPCVQDFCATRYFLSLQRSVLCANFYLYSRRCARHRNPINWRVRAGCPATCGRNQHFSRRIAPCQKTCSSHFFGAPKSCFKLRRSEGCRCNRGFVLDGANCVRPRDCVCLAKLCIDRQPHSKCSYWRSLGRCKRFPKFMSDNCRLTCGLCTPQCKNQVSNRLCKYYRKKGKCRHSFYRAMCQATCNPSGCGCPKPISATSPCSPKYKNRVFVSKRWWPDRTGRCRKSILIRYSPCGLCRRIRRISRGRCNYCKRVRYDTKVIQYRQKYGKRRCIRRVRRVRRSCSCARRPVSFLRCERNRILVRITKYWAITARCSRCVRRMSRVVVRRLRGCTGTYTIGRCRGKALSVVKVTYRRFARNCKCLKRIIRRRRWLCRCNVRIRRRVCKNTRWLFITIIWILRNGRCVKRVSRSLRAIACAPRRRRWKTCVRRSCKAFMNYQHFAVSRCRCRKFTRSALLGKCCCPKGYRRIIRINRYYKKEITVIYKLINYRCRRFQRIRKIRIACPRGGAYVKCNASRGIKIFISWKYRLSGNSCVRVYRRRTVRVRCRGTIKRVVYRCSIRVGNVRYRKVKLIYWRRNRCSCRQLSRIIREMCGCRRGQFLRTIRCPRGCNSKQCSNRCRRYKVYYVFVARGRRCIRRVFRRLAFRCCCRRNRSVKKYCKIHKILVNKVCVTVLKNYKCQRVCNTSSRTIRCRIGRISFWKPHPNRNLRYRVTKIFFRRNCRCRVRVQRRICKSRCSKPTTRKFCDRVNRQKVWQRISWKLVGCQRCRRIVRERRRRIKCRTGIKRWRQCKRNGVLLLHTIRFWQRGCRCYRRKTTVSRRCRCRSSVIGAARCRSNVWVSRVKTWILRNGRCILRISSRRTRVRCGSSRRYRVVCRKKSGIQLKYLGVLRPKKCRCVRVWRLVARRRCNCIIDNRRVANKVRRFCSRNRNITIRYYYILRRGRCILRSRRSSRGIRCRRPFTRRLRCNLSKRKQRFVRHRFVKRNCRCVLVKSNIWRPCGCIGKPITRSTICKPALGIIVTTVITRKWSHRRNLCISIRAVRSRRIACSTRTIYKTGRCIRNKYFVVKKIFYVRRGCRCYRRVHRRRFNCHCKNIIRRYPCRKRRYFRRVVIEFRKWNMKKRICKTVRYVTKKIRCRCPRGFVRRYCSNGARIKKIVRIVLINGRCRRTVIVRRFPVVCRGRNRISYTKCSKCSRFKLTLAPKLNRKRCSCYYAIVKRQRCTCCCPRTQKHKWCDRHTHYVIKYTHYAPYTGRKCSLKCRSWHSRRRWRVPCRRRRRLRWLRCNRRSCVSKQQLLEYRLSRCRCVLYRRLTGRSRTCCCRPNRRTRRVCLNSCLFNRISFTKFVPYRCVRRKRLQLLRIWKCRGRIGSVIGRCNRRSCKQSVQDKYSIVDRPYCRCRTQLRNLRYRRCCCNRRPIVRRRCLGACWKRTRITFSFSIKRRVCVQNIKRSTICIRCGGRKRYVSRCNRRTCRQKITIKYYIVKNCKCVPRYRYSYAVCCCARPRVIGPICISRGRLMWRRISWRLRAGRCMRKETRRYRLIRCRSGVQNTRIQRCNRRSCRQKVLKLFFRLRGCKCLKKWRVSTRVCCCRPAIRRWTRCERHRQLVQYTVTQTLYRWRRCIVRRRRRVLRTVGRCRNRVRVGPCNRRTKKRLVRIFIRAARNCRCVTIRVVRKLVLCRCPPVRIIRSKCNRKTCHRTVTKIWFSSSRKGHGVRCRRHSRRWQLRCCCHRRQTQRRFCDRRTGSLMLRIQWFVFVLRNRSCARRRSVRVIRRLRCRRTSCRISRCNRKSGYKIKVCTHHSPVRSSCSCRTYVTRHRIVCSCRRRLIVRKCVNNNRLVIVTIRWRINRRLNRCVRVRNQVSRDLRCRRRRRIVRKCGRKCSGTKTLYFYRMRNCKCIQLTKRWNIACCCPRNRCTTRCQGNRLVTTCIRYVLRRDRCVRIVRQRARTVRCRRRIVNQSRCRNCKFNKVIRLFAIRRCRCTQVRRIVRRLRCCCRRSIRRKFCRNGSHIKQIISFKLYRYRCLRRVRERKYRVQCPRPTVRISGCHSQSRRRKILITKFVQRGCRCIPRRRVRYEICSCKPSFVIREKCIGKSRRRVLKITFKFIRVKGRRPFCRRMQRLLRFEPCRCAPASRRRRCIGGRKWLKLVTTWKLVTRYSRNFCVSRTRSYERLVRCRRRTVSWTRCSRFRKTRITVYYKPVRCRCRRFVRRRIYACNCSRKNTNRKYCDSKTGRIIKLRKEYFARKGSRTCSFVIRRKIIRIVCNRRIRTVLLSRRCSVRKYFGFYTLLLQKWKIRVGCRCVKRSRRLLKLCRCNRSRYIHRCVNGRIRRKILIKYVRRNNRCRRRQQVWNTTIRCRRTRPIVRFGGCNSRICKRSATLTQCFVRNCRTATYRRSGLQRCCAPKPKRRRYCDKKRGQFVTVITKYYLVSYKPLLKDRNGNVIVRQNRIISRKFYSRRTVRCQRNIIRVTCSRSGIWRKVSIIFRRVACHCVRRRIVRTGKCRCPPSRSTFGRCINRYKTKTTISFVLKARKCLRFVRRRRYLCACLPRRRFTVCDRRGNWKSCLITYRLQFRRQRCRRIVRCTRRRQTCSGVSVRRSRCRKFKQRLTITSWKLNKRRCKCIRVVRSRIVGCNCNRWRYTKVLCVNGCYITKRVTHYLKGYRCVRRIRQTIRFIRCNTRRRTRIVRGSCVTRRGSKKRGYQKLRIDWQVKSGCKCINRHSFRYVPCRCSLIRRFRTRRSRSCVSGSTWVTKIVSYFLRRFTCVRRVRFIRRPVRCRGTRITVSKCKLNRKGDSYKIKKIFRRISNGRCGCRWIVSRVLLSVCSCRKSVQRKLCLRHRISRTEIWKYVRVAGRSFCRRIVRRRDRVIRCRRSYWRRSKCRKCGYRKFLIAYKPRNCICVKYTARTLNLRCCCAKARTVRTCDARRHIITWRTVSYRLYRGRCIRRISSRSLRIRCKRKLPIYKFSKCSGGFRVLRKITFHEVKCVCRRRQTRHRQRCACSRRIIVRRGKCGKWFAVDLVMGWKLVKTGRKIPGTNKRKYKCIRVIVSRRRRRCRCPASFRQRRCLIDRIRTIRVTFRLRGNRCERRRTVSVRRLPCSRRARLVRVKKQRSCSRRYRYVQKLIYYYIQARKCRCVKFTRTKSYICNCFLRYGGRRVIRRCIRHSLLYIKKYWYVNVKRKCVRRIRIQKRRIRCRGTKIQRSRCGRNRRRIFTILKRIVRNCKCIWRVVRRVTAPCRCRSSSRSVRCQGNRWVTRVRRWILVGTGMRARCKLVVRTFVRKIPCRTGTFTRRTPCNARGSLKIIRTTRTLRKCRCVQRVRRTPCRCRCGRSRSRTVCRRNRFVTVTQIWKLKNCRCHGDRIVSRKPVRCPRRTRHLSSCRRRRNGDRYKILRIIYYVKSNCKCYRKIINRNILCGCDSRRRRIVTCRRGNTRIITVTMRKIVRGRCRRVVISRRSVRINCGRMRAKKTCDRKTGIFSIFVIKPFVSACKCKNTVYRFTRRCRCYGGTRLSRRGKCNRRSCRRRLLMKRQILKNQKCIWKYFHRIVICCCRGGSVRRICLSRRGIWKITKIRFVLRSGRCVRSASVSYRRVRCSRKVTVRRTKLRGGVLKIVRCRIVRRGCACRPRCSTTFMRYNCYKTRIVKKCECSRRRCSRVTYVTYWRLISGRCYRKSRRIVKQLQCGLAVIIKSRCKNRSRYGWYAIYRKTQWRMRRCHCVKSTRQWRVMCRCLRNRRSSRCDARRGLIIRTVIRFRLTARRRSCRRIVKVTKQRVNCNSRWRLIKTYRRGTRQIRKYRRYIRIGCRCVARYRTISCIIRCPRCRVSHRCVRNRRIARIRICWRLSSCVCKRTRSISYKTVGCHRNRIIRSCNRRNCVRTIKSIRYFVRNCKCIRSVRVHRSRCCCQRPRVQRRCIRGSIRIRTIRWHLVSGKCRIRISDKHLPVRCPTYRRTAIYGKCIRGRRKYSVHYWARKGCRCVRRVRIILRPCVCARKSVELLFAIDLHDKSVRGYKPAVRKFIRTICSTFLKQMVLAQSTFLTYGSQVGISRKIKLPGVSQLKRIADHLFVRKPTDLKSALRRIRTIVSRRRNKHIHPIVVVISCGNHRHRAGILQQARKLQRIASVVVVQVGKPKRNTKYLQMVASRPRRHNFMYVKIKQMLRSRNHIFPATQLFERVCKRACRRSVLRRSRCHRGSCKRVYTRITYSRNSRTNRCIRRVRSWRRDCCCRRRGGVRLLCRRNRKYRITVTYVYSARRELCSKRVRTIDITNLLRRRCRPAVRVILGRCNGLWRRDVVERRSFVQCLCRVRRLTRRVRCGCRRPQIRLFCRQGRAIVRCVTRFILRRRSCIPRRSCSSVPVNCRKPWKSVSKCSSCIRTIRRVWFVRNNCKCFRKTSVVRRRCCCSTKVQTYRYCDRRRNRIVTVRRSQKLVSGSCRRITRRSYRTITCRSTSQIRGKCRRSGSHFYRKIIVLSWLRKNCACVPIRRVYTRLCRCRRGTIITQCIAGCIVRTRKWWQLISGKCVYRSKVVSNRIVTCSTRKHKSVGSCSIVKNGRRYRKLIIRWQKRIACRCVSQRRIVLQLCACNRSYRRTRCIRGNTQITTIYKYKLYNGRCILYRRQHRKRIICEFARTRTSKCVRNRRIVTVTVYTPVACRCKATVYRKSVSCKSGCRDLLPRKVCRRWASSKLRLCDRYPHYASKYCSNTCGLCYGCLTTTMVYAGRVCLHKQSGFRSDYVIGKAKTLKSCLRSCHSNKRCRAFSFKWHSRKCILFRVTRRDLMARSTRYSLRRGGRCLLFEKVCPKRCPYRRFVKQYRCRCKIISGRKICYRILKVATYSRDRSGRCRRKLSNVRAPCRICEDRTYTKWCRTRRSSCNKPEVKHMCPLTCGLCKRKPLVLTQKGKCKSGTKTIVRVQKIFDKRNSMWRIRQWKTTVPCVRCATGAYTIVGECIRGIRKVTRVVARRIGGRCKVHARTKTFPCRGCAFSLRRVIGSCIRRGRQWRRKVVTFFTVRRRNRCVVLRDIRNYRCSRRCPRDFIRSSRCHCGKQIRCIKYFVTFPGSSVCVPKTHSFTRVCNQPVCKNHLRMIDCLLVKRKGMCRNRKMRHLCARTCGICR